MAKSACQVVILVVLAFYVGVAHAGTWQADVAIQVGYSQPLNGTLYYSTNLNSMRLDVKKVVGPASVEPATLFPSGKLPVVTHVYDLTKKERLELTKSNCFVQSLSPNEKPALFWLSQATETETTTTGDGTEQVVRVVIDKIGQRTLRFTMAASGEFPLKITSEHFERGFEQSMDLYNVDSSDPSRVESQIRAPGLDDNCLLTPYTSATSCKNDCNARGECFGGDCYCFVGFAGVDCALTPSFVAQTSHSKRQTCSCDPVPCHLGLCQNGVCQYFLLPAGAVCDDGNRCTFGDQCLSDGSCVSTAVDCASLTDQCQTGTCNPSTGICEPVYPPYNTSCYLPNDGGQPNGLCRNGVCVDPNAALCGNGVVDIGTSEECDPGDPNTGSEGRCCPGCKRIGDEVGGCAPRSLASVYHVDCFASYCFVPTGQCIYDFLNRDCTCGPNNAGRCDGEGNCVL